MSNMQATMEVINRYLPKNFKPKAGLILGSGLSSLAEQITDSVTISYEEIPGIPVGNVSGHSSTLILGYLNGVPVACLKGRLHLYEGVSYTAIQTLVRIVKCLGAEILVITAAVGSLIPEAGPGELVMVNDHINFHPGNPLAGPNDDAFGARFVGLEDAYDPALQAIMLKAAAAQNIKLHQGVYISTLGPSFETPAEIRAYKKWGADVVGMSVVPEVIIARHCGLRVTCVAAVTNAAVGMSDEKVTHEGTLQFGEIGAKKLVRLIPVFLSDYHANS